MAVTITPIPGGFNGRVFDIIASADADTTAAITHGFQITPVTVMLEPLLAAFYVSQWVVTSVTSTVVTLTKGVGVGSGNAAAQLRVLISPFHTHQLMPTI